MGIFSNQHKPRIDPPQDLDNEPDFSELVDILEKHQEIALKLAHKKIGGLKSWVEIREAIKDAVNYQFAGISNFLDRHFYQQDKQKEKLHQKRISQYSNFTASSSWAVGREWGLRDPELRDRVRKLEYIDIYKLPKEVVELLKLSVFDIYSMFYFPHKFFYESPYGRLSRGQMDNHMRDTYQSMMKGALMCFLSGVKSHDLE